MTSQPKPTSEPSVKPFPLAWGVPFANANGIATGVVALDLSRSEKIQKMREIFGEPLTGQALPKLAVGLIGESNAKARVLDAVARSEAQAAQRREAELDEEGHGEKDLVARQKEKATQLARLTAARERRLLGVAMGWGGAQTWSLAQGVEGLWAISDARIEPAPWPCQDAPIEAMATAAAEELKAVAGEIFGAECVLFSRVVSPEENRIVDHMLNTGFSLSLEGQILASIEKQALERATRDAASGAALDGPKSHEGQVWQERPEREQGSSQKTSHENPLDPQPGKQREMLLWEFRALRGWSSGEGFALASAVVGVDLARSPVVRKVLSAAPRMSPTEAAASIAGAKEVVEKIAQSFAEDARALGLGSASPFGGPDWARGVELLKMAWLRPFNAEGGLSPTVASGISIQRLCGEAENLAISEEPGPKANFFGAFSAPGEDSVAKKNKLALKISKLMEQEAKRLFGEEAFALSGAFVDANDALRQLAAIGEKNLLEETAASARSHSPAGLPPRAAPANNRKPRAL